jgi:predicted alpha/beta hydrolase
MPSSLRAPLARAIVRAVAASGESFEVETPDGARIRGDRIAARVPEGGRARGAVWVGHALLANRRSLDRPRGAGLASALAESGLHVYTFDVRGHGESLLPPGSRGWTYEDLVRGDLPAVARAVRERHPDLKVAGVGHSLTGHAGLAWLGLSSEPARPSNGGAGARPPSALRERAPGPGPGGAPLDAFVSIASNIWVRRLEPSLSRWARKRALFGALRALAALAGRLPAKAAGAGSEDAPSSFTGPWFEWTENDRWTSPEGEDYLAALERVRVPVLAVTGAGDTLLCHPTCGALFHARLVRASVTSHTSDASECGFDPDHMGLVTDARARPLWRRIAGWLAETLDPGGGT